MKISIKKNGGKCGKWQGKLDFSPKIVAGVAAA